MTQGGNAWKKSEVGNVKQLRPGVVDLNDFKVSTWLLTTI